MEAVQGRARRLQIAEAVVVASYFEVVPRLASYIPHERGGASSITYSIALQLAHGLVLCYLLYASRDLGPIFRLNRGNYRTLLLASVIAIGLPFLIWHSDLLALTKGLSHVADRYAHSSRATEASTVALLVLTSILSSFNIESLRALVLLRLGGPQRYSLPALAAQAAIFCWPLLLPGSAPASDRLLTVTGAIILGFLFQWSRSLWPAILMVIGTMLYVTAPLFSQ